LIALPRPFIHLLFASGTLAFIEPTPVAGIGAVRPGLMNQDFYIRLKRLEVVVYVSRIRPKSRHICRVLRPLLNRHIIPGISKKQLFQRLSFITLPLGIVGVILKRLDNPPMTCKGTTTQLRASDD